MKHDYAALDKAILKSIENSPSHRFGGAFGSQVQEETSRLAAAELAADPGKRYPKPAFRFLDSRLQALRKAGHIEYSSKAGWCLTPKA